MNLADACWRRLAALRVRGTDLSSSVTAGSRPGSSGRSRCRGPDKKGERVACEAEQAARRGVPRGPPPTFRVQSPTRSTVRESEAQLIREADRRFKAGESATLRSPLDWNSRIISPTAQDAADGRSGSSAGPTSVLRNPQDRRARAYKGRDVADRPAARHPAPRTTREALQGRIGRTRVSAVPPRRTVRQGPVREVLGADVERWRQKRTANVSGGTLPQTSRLPRLRPDEGRRRPGRRARRRRCGRGARGPEARPGTATLPRPVQHPRPRRRQVIADAEAKLEELAADHARGQITNGSGSPPATSSRTRSPPPAGTSIPTSKGRSKTSPAPRRPSGKRGTPTRSNGAGPCSTPSSTR